MSYHFRLGQLSASVMMKSLIIARLFASGICCVRIYMHACDSVLMFECSTLCDPYLNIFRGIIPPLGGTLDLSPILAFLVLNAFTSTATALPAELPENGASPRSRSSPTLFTHLTTAQEKWMRRLHGNKSKSSPGAA